MDKQTHIIIIEDHPEFRETVEFVLGNEKDMLICKQFGNAELALRELEHGRLRGTIDLILLDLNLPGLSGLEAIPWIKKYDSKVKILVLSQSHAEADILKSIQLGAAGYLLKSSTMTELIEGIRRVMDGGAILDANLAKFILKTLKTYLPENNHNTALSKREMDVLIQIAKGSSQKEIGDELNISTYTVTDHLKHIYEKLQVKNAPEAIHEAHKRGIFN